jgi:hypothetical protein
MPVLRNPRHEAFARAIFRGIFEPDLYPTRGTAYRAAGYRASGLREPGGSAEVNASRLLKNAKILDRVRELQAEAAQEVKETIDKCVAELNEDRRDAKAQGQHAAAISAVMGKAKLLGLVTDKHEDVTSKPDFSKATSLNDVGIKLLQSVGYAEPSPADVALALEAHEHLIAQLEAIAERAQSLSAEQ